MNKITEEEKASVSNELILPIRETIERFFGFPFFDPDQKELLDNFIEYLEKQESTLSNGMVFFLGTGRSYDEVDKKISEYRLMQKVSKSIKDIISAYEEFNDKMIKKDQI